MNEKEEQINRDLNLIEKLGLKLTYILETHIHADHITGASILKEKTGAKICCGSKTGAEGADLLLEDGYTLDVGDFSLDVLHTPGHTEGSVCLKISNDLFTGDTLFQGKIGRIDLPGGNKGSLQSSLKQLSKLCADLNIYPGHGESSTIQKELESNREFIESIQ